MLLVIILVIVSCGLIGGSARYIVYLTDEERRFELLSCCRDILLGIVAASIIPLFLGVLSIGGNKGLIQNLLDSKNPTIESGWFVLIGFCMLASFYSKSFIQSVAAKTIHKANKAIKDAESASIKAENAVAIANDAIEDAVEVAKEVKPPDKKLEETEMKILKAMSESKYRRSWPITISEFANISEDKVKQGLTKLEEKGLVQQHKLSNEGNQRWRIRPWGRVALHGDTETSQQSK